MEKEDETLKLDKEVEKGNSVIQKPKTEERKLPEGAIKTFKQGSADAVKGKQGIFVKVAIAEEKKREAQREAFEKTEREKTAFSIFGAILIVISLGIFIGIFFLDKNKQEEVTFIEPLKFGTIYTSIDTTDLSKDVVLSNLRAKMSEPIQDGLIKTISLIKKDGFTIKPITTKEFFNLFAMYPPEELVNSILSEIITLNVYSENGENIPFVMIRANSGTNALQEMYFWEPALLRDFSELFMMDEDDRITIDLFRKSFEDNFINNHGSRTIKNTNGETVFLYTLLNDQTLIFTNKESALVNIVNWLYAPTIRN